VTNHAGRNPFAQFVCYIAFRIAEITVAISEGRYRKAGGYAKENGSEGQLTFQVFRLCRGALVFKVTNVFALIVADVCLQQSLPKTLSDCVGCWRNQANRRKSSSSDGM
jgi:hypothetical protein